MVSSGGSVASGTVSGVAQGWHTAVKDHEAYSATLARCKMESALA